MNTKQMIRELIEEAGLSQFADEIMKLVKPAIEVRINRTKEAEMPIGASKFGGSPDLPPDVSWPMFDEFPLSFFAQIDLAEVASHDKENMLPDSGTLYFFSILGYPNWFDMNYHDNPSAWRVIYFAGDRSILKRVRPPSTLSASAMHLPCKTEFRNELTLPCGVGDRTRQLHQIGLTEEQDEIYQDKVYFAEDKHSSRGILNFPIHQLLGWPTQLQNDLQISAEVNSKGLSWEDANPDNVDSWRLLLEIESDETMRDDLDIGTGPTQYFMIHDVDLLEKNFDQVWLCVQF